MHAATRGEQIERQHMRAKAARLLMVLAVHVVGHRTADGGEAGAGGNRRGKTTRQEFIDELAKIHPRFHLHDAGFGIEAQNAVEAGGEKGGTLVVQRAVAIGAAGRVRNHAMGAGPRMRKGG